MDPISETSWQIRANPGLSPEEQAAYDAMQQAITATIASDKANPNERPDRSLSVVEAEGETIDFSSAEGRAKRSHRNLNYIKARNEDCPRSLMGELRDAMRQRECVMQFNHNPHNAGSAESILATGKLLSNYALKAKGIKTSGGTDSCVLDDQEIFGNTDFVFTRPLFCESGSALTEASQKFLIPANSEFLEQYAWMSFHDWANYRNNFKPRDEYCGSPLTEDSQHSFVCDFFVGKDIPDAVAYKLYELLKTAVVLHSDPDATAGFNTEEARSYIHNISRLGVREHWFERNNHLDKPLASYELSEKQTAFLSGRSEARNQLVQEAITTTLDSMRRNAEMKIPAFLALDGAALPDHNGGVKQLKSDAGKADILRFDWGEPITSETVIVPADPRALQARTICPDRY